MTIRQRWVSIAALALVGLGTAYTLLVGTLWFIEAHSARSTVSGLSATLTEEKAALDALLDEADALADEVEANVDTIGETANDRAQAEDDFIVYGYIAFGLADCVRERADLIDVVKHRYEYYLWSIRAVESDLNAYCREAHSIYTDIVAEDAE